MITEDLQKKIEQSIRLLQQVQKALDEYASMFKS